MPYATTDDGVRLYYEETGSGTPVIFVHEFAGDHRSWEPQLRHFGQRYRAITFAARGYPPSDVPEERRAIRRTARPTTSPPCSTISPSPAPTSSACRWAASPRCISASAIRPRAVALRRRLRLRRRARQRDQFRAEAEARSPPFATHGMEAFAAKYAYGPTRVQFENKDPRGFAEFQRQLAEHSALGAPNTQLGVQRERPSLYDLMDQMRALTVPALVLTGDEDWPCLHPAADEADHPVRRPGRDAELRPHDQSRGPDVQPPVGDFLAQVDAGRWPSRDPRAASDSITGLR